MTGSGKRRQAVQAHIERRGRKVGADRCRAPQDLIAIGAQHPDVRLNAAIFRTPHEGFYFLAFVHRRPVVRRDTAAAQPQRTPERESERCELAEVRGSFDRCA
jgi:hypothetical protein